MTYGPDPPIGLFSYAVHPDQQIASGGTPCHAQADDHLDAGHFHAVRRLGQVGDAEAGRGHVDEFALIFQEEVVMLGRVGVDIGLGPIDGELAQQAASVYSQMGDPLLA